MFDGKMLRAATGTPMRRIARANKPFADADPEPLTFANLTTKSLMRAIGFMSVPKGRPEELTRPLRGQRAERAWGSFHDVLLRRQARKFHRHSTRVLAVTPIVGMCGLEQEFLHVPC